MLKKILVVLALLYSFGAIAGEASKLNTIGLVQYDANAKKSLLSLQMVTGLIQVATPF